MTVHRPVPRRRGRPWLGGNVRWTAGSVVLAMAITLLEATSSGAAAPTGAAEAPRTATATQAADISSARVAARLSGKRVEALSERTETSTTWVNKDGSLTTEFAAGPVRFERDGEWVDVDVELRESGSGVEPVAHPEGLRLAGKTGTPAKSLRAAREAKATDLVTLGEGDRQITLQWKGGLPKPKLDGTRAEYVNAVPGADVVVEATRTGFEQYVEIKQRPGTGGYSYTLPLRAKGLKAKQLADGSVLFTDKKNKKRAVMPAPVMWDATVDKRSGEHTRRAKVGLKVVQRGSTVDLVVSPDAKFLADPDTQYPVTVDPSTSSSPTSSTPMYSRARRSTGPLTPSWTWAIPVRPTPTAPRAPRAPSSPGTPRRSRTRWYWTPSCRCGTSTRATTPTARSTRGRCGRPTRPRRRHAGRRSRRGQRRKPPPPRPAATRRAQRSRTAGSTPT